MFHSMQLPLQEQKTKHIFRVATGDIHRRYQRYRTPSDNGRNGQYL